MLDRLQDAIEVRKNIGRGHSSSMWLMAYLEGMPAGYALANLADEQGFEGLSAWLVDIGCVPEQRRKGIASALLNEIVWRTKSAGGQRLLASIDEVNVPSIRHHMSLGFHPLQDRHYVYQLPCSNNQPLIDHSTAIA
jgi:GNAT superfamily N-acetyltransferase